MENAKRTYEMLNSELHDELPALYDSRVLFLVTNMQTLFAAEEVFHSETSKVTDLDIDLYISINIKYLESTFQESFFFLIDIVFVYTSIASYSNNTFLLLNSGIQ